VIYFGTKYGHILRGEQGWDAFEPHIFGGGIVLIRLLRNVCVVQPLVLQGGPRRDTDPPGSPSRGPPNRWKGSLLPKRIRVLLVDGGDNEPVRSDGEFCGSRLVARCKFVVLKVNI
jgi:hypothetical protein